MTVCPIAGVLTGSVDDKSVRITYDPEGNAAYIYLMDEQLLPGRDSVRVDPPEGMQAWIVLDWKDGMMVGLEVLDAATLLHPDLLAQAVHPDQEYVCSEQSSPGRRPRQRLWGAFDSWGRNWVAATSDREASLRP